MEKLRLRAKALGATDLKLSNRKGKRLAVLWNNEWIHFGSKTGSTYFDHGDKEKRDAWYARHRKIKNKYGKHVINIPTSPDYWAARILW